jgi:PAS domain S-box-containing protein
MPTKRKSKEFRLEIRLGLILIILLLAILDFASYYTLYRIGQTVEGQIREELTEAAVVISNSMTRLDLGALPPGLEENIKEKYLLNSLDLIQLDYDRVISIKRESKLDADFQKIDSTLISGELSDLLINKPIYRHKNGSDLYQLLFPTEFNGSTYLIAVSKPCGILGPTESAMRVLVFFGFLTAIVIIFVSVRLLHTVLYPFDRLKEKAEKSGHYDRNNRDEVGQLIDSYETIINDLKIKELELVKLNQIITQKAADLEIYNDYILKSVSAGIITLDGNRTTSTINRAAGEILGLEISRLIGIESDYLLGDFPQLRNLIDKYYETGEPIAQNEIRIRTVAGRDSVLAVSVSPLIDSSGVNIGCTIILNDQTEYIRLQEELALNRQMAVLGEMSAGLAHQLRNSTAAIVGFAKLIEKKSDNNSVYENIKILTHEAMQAEALIARFLDYSRPLKVAIEQCDLMTQVSEIKMAVEQKYPNIDMKFEAAADDRVFVPGDSLLLKQALSNIIDNACKSYNGGSGSVIIKYFPAGQEHIIEIIDNGSGISETDRDNVFTPFFSGSPSGSGLGLPLALKIVTLHDGTIDFKDNPGGGTIFSISLPARDSEELSFPDSKTTICRK